MPRSTMFRDLPRDLQLRIVKLLGIDERRVCGVPPGKLRIPPGMIAMLHAVPKLEHTQRGGARTARVRLGPLRDLGWGNMYNIFKTVDGAGSRLTAFSVHEDSRGRWRKMHE